MTGTSGNGYQASLALRPRATEASVACPDRVGVKRKHGRSCGVAYPNAGRTSREERAARLGALGGDSASSVGAIVLRRLQSAESTHLLPS